MCFIVALGLVSLIASAVVGITLAFEVVMLILGVLFNSPSLVAETSRQIQNLFWPMVVLGIAGLILLTIAEAWDD